MKSLPDQWYLGIIKPIVNKHQIFDQIEVYRTADSTQIIAKQMLVNNSKSYLILSDEQTKGRGRFNRN